MRRPLSRRFSSARAFTLIELLVVILVIGILIAVAAPSFLGQTDKAHESAAKQTLAVAYRAAKAGTIREPNQGQFGTAAQVAADINAAEPGINASAGNCPDDVSASIEDVIVDSSYTGGQNLLLCNDPDRNIFYLTVANGVLQPMGTVEWVEGDPAPTIPGDGPTAVEETITDTGGPGDPVSTDPEADEASTSDPVETTVEPPSSGPVTITETPGTTGSQTGTDMIDWTVTVDAPAGTAASPIIFTFIIDASLVPAGMTDAHETRVFKDGTRIDANDVMCSGTPAGAADPDPCVDDRSFVAGGDLRIVVFSSTDGVFTFGFPSAAPVGGSCDPSAGDIPNNAAGAPANDDFCKAELLSGASGSVNGSLVGATIQQGGTPREVGDPGGWGYDEMSYGMSATRSVWYKWVAPSTANYTFDTIGSPAPFTGNGSWTAAAGPPFVGVWKNTVWGTGGNAVPNENQLVTANWQNGWNGSEGWTEVTFSAQAGDVFMITVTNGTDAPDEGSFKINWTSDALDTDNDGINNGSDNCPTVANPGQADYNSNGQGDACDAPPLVVKVTNNSGYPIAIRMLSVGALDFGDPNNWVDNGPPGPSTFDVCAVGAGTCTFTYANDDIASGYLATWANGPGHASSDANVLSWTGMVGTSNCSTYQSGANALHNACVFAPGSATLVPFEGRVAEITAN